jgi:hypothetical protein
MTDLLQLYFSTKNLLTFLRISAAWTNLLAFMDDNAASKSVYDASCIILYFLNHSEILSSLVSNIELGLEFTLIPYTLISFMLYPINLCIAS